MEMPEQDAPVVFSQMSQMFPNIPHDIIQMYVQKYSSDAEKCTQMLNLQNGKYTELQLPALNNCKNLNTSNNLFQAPDLMVNSETVLDNNNDSLLIQLPLFNSKESNTNKDFLPTSHTEQTYPVPINIAENIPTNFPRTNINFNEPLILNIEPDCDDMSHSWRPTVSADLLNSDLFIPSPMFENAQTHSVQVSNMNFELNSSECSITSESLEKEKWRSSNSGQRVYDSSVQSGGYFGKDVGSYLHYQKSQMNIMRYEVIKAKIDLGDLRDCIEKLEMELKEKMQSTSVQDIIDLNKEIEQLRLDCQYLCTEIDHIVKDSVLLGEVNEKFYEKNEASLKTKDTQNASNHHCVNSDADCIAAQNESNKWPCLKCTFVNHPAISACEMCQSPKPAHHSRPPLFPPATSCYCHPKDKSLPVQS